MQANGSEKDILFTDSCHARIHYSNTRKGTKSCPLSTKIRAMVTVQVLLVHLFIHTGLSRLACDFVPWPVMRLAFSAAIPYAMTSLACESLGVGLQADSACRAYYSRHEGNLEVNVFQCNRR